MTRCQVSRDRHVTVRCGRSSFSLEENKFHITRYSDEEPARVDSVKLLGDPAGSEILQAVMLVLRVEVSRRRRF